LRSCAQLNVTPSRLRSLFQVARSSSSAPSRIHLHHRGVLLIIAPYSENESENE
jgi:hypothetical protein